MRPPPSPGGVRAGKVVTMRTFGTTLGFVGLLAGCGVVEPACTEIAVVSVTVNVVDPDGGDVDNVAVTYSVDGGTDVICLRLSDERSIFACGYEVAGSMEIAVLATGYAPFDRTVIVEADACHVIPQTLEAVLEPVPG